MATLEDTVRQLVTDETLRCTKTADRHIESLYATPEAATALARFNIETLVLSPETAALSARHDFSAHNHQVTVNGARGLATALGQKFYLNIIGIQEVPYTQRGQAPQSRIR